MATLAGLTISILCGFLPMIFLAGVIYGLDRYEKEPIRLLVEVFGWGAVVAVVGSLVTQAYLDRGVLLLTGSRAIEEISGSSLFAPVTEEIFKGLAVLLVFIRAPAEFDSILDGIVYAAITALGFAATEDALYYFSAFQVSGLSALATLIFMRLVLFGWQHAFFTAFTGIGLAVARMSAQQGVRLTAPLLGLGMAIFMHALHNSLLTFFSGLAGITVAAFVAWSGWLVMLGFILYLISRERSWISQYLRDEVALNTLTEAQYRTACSLFGQTRARLEALSRGCYRQTAHFYQLCGELSHKKRQLATLGDETGNLRQVEALRAELARISQLL